MGNTVTQHGQTDESDTPDIGGRTIADICEAHGLDPESVRQAWNRAKKKGADLRSFSRTLTPTPAEMSAVSCLANLGGKATTEATKKAESVAIVAAPAVTVPMPDSLADSLGITALTNILAPKSKGKANTKTAEQASAEGGNWPMWVIMCASTLVTLQSVSNVTGTLFKEHEVASLTLTAVLCAVPLVVSWQKKVPTEHKIVVGGLIVFEGFCNTARIYAGLLNFEFAATSGEPTLFLQMVMGMLGTGKNGTALTLSIAIAVIIAVIFGMAFRAINKKK